MKEFAEKFISKECLISSFDGRQYEGIIKEVNQGAILIEKDEKLEALNLDFIARIREYPRNKNGKKKSVVLDWQITKFNNQPPQSLKFRGGFTFITKWQIP